MLINTKTIRGFALSSIDGEFGKVEQFYFDDRYWTIRYLIANTGNWLTGRQVLISPYALGEIDDSEKSIDVDLTRKKIEDSPSLSSDEPVSRQFEDSYYGYYGWPGYWGGPYMWGDYSHIERDRDRWIRPSNKENSWDPHLRSTHDVSGHNLQASDGEIGYVEEFIVDSANWAIRYLVINTRHWWNERTILLSPKWIERVSWSESKIFTNLTREEIKSAPEFTGESLVTRDFEEHLHEHYKHKGYWLEEAEDGRSSVVRK